jgi:glutathione S-transferase
VRRADGDNARAAVVITLHRFGRFFGTPDSSPFVIKTMMLLKLAGLAYRDVRGNPLRAPKKLLPSIEDDGEVVADSTLIRFHIEQKYGFDFDAALSPEQKAVAWAVERMCEDHLYFAMLDLRWRDRANFVNGVATMFDFLPRPLRPIVKAMLRRMNAKRLFGHGLGRHPTAEIARLAIRDFDALAVLLGDKPYLMGDTPCGADATVFGFVTAILTPPLETPIRAAALRHANFVSYRDRITRAYFPETRQEP